MRLEIEQPQGSICIEIEWGVAVTVTGRGESPCPITFRDLGDVFDFEKDVLSLFAHEMAEGLVQTFAAQGGDLTSAT
jgi:hypothetical protein